MALFCHGVFTSTAEVLIVDLDELKEVMREMTDSNASNVLRAALRLLEEQEAKLTALRAALIEEEESGPSTLLDFETFVARKRNQKPKAP